MGTTTDDTVPRPSQLIAGKYRVERTLGQGSTGIVFEVTHRVTSKRFALKWLRREVAANAQAMQRFLREAEAAGRVDHPNVVSVFDVGQDDNSLFIVMELLEGEPLSALLARDVRLPATTIGPILVGVCDGLHAAHMAGVIHRDVKPDNVFLVQTRMGDQRPKLLDFGVSKLSGAAVMTRPGMVVGTPQYMAPEQLMTGAIDARTDVYAVGVMLYRALAGRLPFGADNYPELSLQVLTATPVPLARLAPDAPPALVKLAERAMARDPAERVTDMQELSRGIAAVLTADARVTPAVVATPASTSPIELRGAIPRATRLQWRHVLAFTSVLGLLLFASRELMPSTQLRRSAGVPASSAPPPLAADNTSQSNRPPLERDGFPSAPADQLPIANTRRLGGDSLDPSHPDQVLEPPAYNSVESAARMPTLAPASVLTTQPARTQPQRRRSAQHTSAPLVAATPASPDETLKEPWLDQPSAQRELVDPWPDP